MIIRVWGKVDGADVIFNPTPCPDWWDITVPYDEDGMYIAEIWAEDDGHYITYRTAILYITDGRLTKLKFCDGYNLTYCKGYTLMLSTNTSAAPIGCRS